jgi:ferritin-like metal-binding protein YciE
MPIETLHDLYVDELKDLYSAENQIIKALPRIIKKANAPQLQKALQDHLDVTQTHVERLDRIISNLGEKSKGKKCLGMEGLLEEGKELLQEEADAKVLDAGLIGAAQKVEHYEIAGYGTVRAHAEQLGHSDAARLLQQTLDEEGEADKLLTSIAESLVNAMAADDEEDEEEMLTTASTSTWS